jgi:hypothetical protein
MIGLVALRGKNGVSLSDCRNGPVECVESPRTLPHWTFRTFGLRRSIAA